MIKLRFVVQVETLGRALNVERDWTRIARRIAKAAKGRSKLRDSQVWADGAPNVYCDGNGKIEVKRIGA